VRPAGATAPWPGAQAWRLSVYVSVYMSVSSAPLADTHACHPRANTCVGCMQARATLPCLRTCTRHLQHLHQTPATLAPDTCNTHVYHPCAVLAVLLAEFVLYDASPCLESNTQAVSCARGVAAISHTPAQHHLSAPSTSTCLHAASGLVALVASAGVETDID